MEFGQDCVTYCRLFRFFHAKTTVTSAATPSRAVPTAKTSSRAAGCIELFPTRCGPGGVPAAGFSVEAGARVAADFGVGVDVGMATLVDGVAVAVGLDVDAGVDVAVAAVGVAVADTPPVTGVFVATGSTGVGVLMAPPLTGVGVFVGGLGVAVFVGAVSVGPAWAKAVCAPGSLAGSDTAMATTARTAPEESNAATVREYIS